MENSRPSGQYQKLPPGWDAKYDQTTGNCYYINYLTKAMQLEDPRVRYRQLQNERSSTESIPLQPLHGGSGGSPYHVYPSNNLPAMRAFQLSGGGGGNGSISTGGGGYHNMSASPLLGQSSRGHLEMSPLPIPRSHGSHQPLLTHTPRLGGANNHMTRRQTIQETSFTNPIDVDAVVMKIQNMFPTASEHHIRLLLKKYYNREAVVISALQVEKHPVTMPGPFVTPPAQRHLFHSNSAFYMTPPARRLGGGYQPLSNHSGGGGSVAGSTTRTASPAPTGGTGGGAGGGGRYGSVMSMQSGSGSGIGVGVGGGGVGAAVVANRAIAGSGCYDSVAPLPPTSLPYGYQYHHGSPRYMGHGQEPAQWRSSPKPHSSPKMKLRYVKNIFPKADEMLILDVLAGADNNVQTASEQLIALGYVKRDVVSTPKPGSQRSGGGGGAGAGGEDGKPQRNADDEKFIPLRPKEYTQQDKAAMETHLKQQYPQIAERIIIMALESVNYAEDRATQILQIVQAEEDEARGKKPQTLDIAATATDASSAVDGGVGMKRCAYGAAEAAADNILTVVLETTTTTESTNANIESTNTNKGNDATTTKNAQVVTTAGGDIGGDDATKRTLAKKRTMPSINLITPTTATTQIILSNSPICIDNKSSALMNADGYDNSNSSSTSNNNNNNNNGYNNDNDKKAMTQSQSQSSESQSSLQSPTPTPTPSPSSSAATAPSSSAAMSSMSPSPSSSLLTTKHLLSHTYSVNGYLHGTNKAKNNNNNNKFNSITASNSQNSASMDNNSQLTRSRDKADSLNRHHTQRNASTDQNSHDGKHPKQQQKQQQEEFKSILGRIATMGHNGQLASGADEGLLLADYVTWNGANPSIFGGQRQLAAGPDAALLGDRNCNAIGRNTDICKGPKTSLAKGSIYTQLAVTNSRKQANIKCN